MNTIRGTNMRNQFVLERFFRVQGNNVEACWSGQNNMASGTQWRRIGVERTTETPTEKMKIRASSIRTTVVRVNPISESPVPTK